MNISSGFSRGRLIVVPVRLVHAAVAVRARMVLDTGARVTVIVPRVAQELGFKAEEAAPTASIVGATGGASATPLTVKSVSLFGIEIRDLPVLCYDLAAKLGLDGVLGINFLNRFNVEISYETETVTLARWGE